MLSAGLKENIQYFKMGDRFGTGVLPAVYHFFFYFFYLSNLD